MEQGADRQSGAAGDPDDHQLLLAAAAGETEALGLLYDRYGRFVFTLALRITGDRGVAEEVTQDSFLRLWQYAHRYEAKRGNVLPWLLTIARRRAIDELRSRRGVSREREVLVPEIAQLPYGVDFASLAQLRVDLQQALRELPAAQREAIELVFFSGLSREELARRTNHPLSTIHTRLRLGFEKLRTILLKDDRAERPDDQPREISCDLPSS
jgi:RNA polymerase sigma-70 factor, ECF subfamily